MSILTPEGMRKAKTKADDDKLMVCHKPGSYQLAWRFVEEFQQRIDALHHEELVALTDGADDVEEIAEFYIRKREAVANVATEAARILVGRDDEQGA